MEAMTEASEAVRANVSKSSGFRNSKPTESKESDSGSLRIKEGEKEQQTWDKQGSRQTFLRRTRSSTKSAKPRVVNRPPGNHMLNFCKPTGTGRHCPYNKHTSTQHVANAPGRAAEG
jgi:hypothetical protein